MKLDALLTEDQISLRDMVHDFVAAEVVPNVKEYDEKGEVMMSAYHKAVEMGINCLDLPEEYGGPGISYLTGALVKEELGWADAGFAATIGANALGMKPLMFAGTEEQRRHFADIVTGGGFSAFALTEPNAGSDAGAMATTAKAVGNDYVLNGRKCFCTNAQYAEIFTIFASVDRSQGVKGITAFLVDRDTPGLSIGKHEDKLGQRTSVTNDVVLEDLVIPAKSRIGEEGKGFVLAMRTLDRGRAGAAATAVGLARAVLEQSVVYAQQRKSMGKQIIDHQAIQFMLADMATQIEASRQLAWYAARLIDAGHPSAGKVGAMAKCLATDTAVKAATDGIQIMGGYGYSREYPMEKLYRDAKIFQIFEGTNQIQRMVIGGALKKEYKI